jgi:transmembrane sensor
MSELRFPLKDHLQDPVDEAAIHRVGLEVDARLQGSRRRRTLPLVLASAATAAGIAVLLWSNSHRSPGPLRLADGREIVAVTAANAGNEIDLSDGSRIRLSPGARIEPLQSTGAKFSAIVTQGHADFDVRPGGPRHWTIECGLATVEVIGTAFACERDPGRLRVVVRHGSVLVRGDRVPDRARRLTAGEVLEIADSGALAAPTAALAPSSAQASNEHPSPLVEPGPAAAPRPEAASPGGRAGEKPWRYLARRGRHREAFAALGSDGFRRESERLGVNDLLALADVARLSGHPAEAVMPLERIVAEFSSDSQAPLAAFALGRLELDALGQARAAVSAFRKALDLGIPRGLREDVRARLVEACARSGDAGAAGRAAEAYRAEFPDGRHARAIEGWLQNR